MIARLRLKYGLRRLRLSMCLIALERVLREVKAINAGA